jgi:hypothetical protein
MLALPARATARVSRGRPSQQTPERSKRKSLPISSAVLVLGSSGSWRPVPAECRSLTEAVTISTPTIVPSMAATGQMRRRRPTSLRFAGIALVAESRAHATAFSTGDMPMRPASGDQGWEQPLRSDRVGRSLQGKAAATRVGLGRRKEQSTSGVDGQRSSRSAPPGCTKRSHLVGRAVPAAVTRMQPRARPALQRKPSG